MTCARVRGWRLALECMAIAVASLMHGCNGGDGPSFGSMANVRVSAASGSTVQAESARIGAERWRVGAWPGSAPVASLQSLAVPQLAQIKVTVSAPDFPLITQVVPASQSSVSLQVPIGAARVFALTYLAADGTVLGFGQSTADIAGGSVDIAISVSPGVPGIAIAGVVSDLNVVEAGNSFNVTLSVSNASGTTATLTDAGLRFRTATGLVDGSSNVSVTVKTGLPLTLRTGQSKNVLLNVLAVASAASGLYQLDGMIAGTLGGEPFALRTSLQSVLFRAFSERTVSLFAGNGTAGTTGDGQLRTSGSVEFNAPIGMAQDAAGNIFVSELSGNVIREIDTTGILSTVAGNGTGAFRDDPIATNGEIQQPRGMVAASGGIYLADEGNHRVRFFSVGGSIITTVGTGGIGSSGDGGPPLAAQIAGPEALVFDPVTGELLIADSLANNVRAAKFSTNQIRTIAGSGATGHGGDGGPPTAAQVEQPTALAFDAQRNLLIGHVVTSGPNNFGFLRRVTRGPGGDLATGTISTLAGALSTALSYGGGALGAPIGPPTALMEDTAGDLVLPNPFGIFAIDPEGNLALLEGNPSGPTALPQTPATKYRNGSLGQAVLLPNGTILAVDFSDNIIIQLQ